MAKKPAAILVLGVVVGLLASRVGWFAAQAPVVAAQGAKDSAADFLSELDFFLPAAYPPLVRDTASLRTALRGLLPYLVLNHLQLRPLAAEASLPINLRTCVPDELVAKVAAKPLTPSRWVFEYQSALDPDCSPVAQLQRDQNIFEARMALDVLVADGKQKEVKTDTFVSHFQDIMKAKRAAKGLQAFTTLTNLNATAGYTYEFKAAFYGGKMGEHCLHQAHRQLTCQVKELEILSSQQQRWYELRSLKFQDVTYGDSQDTWYSAGRVQLTLNDWQGEVRYQHGMQPPAYRFTHPQGASLSGADLLEFIGTRPQMGQHVRGGGNGRQL